MIRVIGDLVSSIQVDFWVHEHPNGRRSYRLMRFISDKVRETWIKTRTDEELSKIMYHWLEESKLRGITPDNEWYIEQHLWQYGTRAF